MSVPRYFLACNKLVTFLFSKDLIWLTWSRYEFQEDNTVLGEEHFPYDSDWVQSEIRSCLEFWMGEREGRCTPEGWKCRFCQFADICPTQTKPVDGTPS
jgi:hypothetical protein